MANIDSAFEQDQEHERQESVITYPLLPLRIVDLPRVIPYHRFNLADQGWTTVTYDGPTDKLYISCKATLQASRAFFNLPSHYKQTFQTKYGSGEGWSCVKGEKEFITLRSLDRTPDGLKLAVSAFWAEAAGFLKELLGRIAESLGLPSDAMTVFSEPCIDFGREKSATMLRLFRYEGSQDYQSNIVAEAHKDLGLLSLVISDWPGLEVWNRYTQNWFPIERSYFNPAGSLLVGRQLERLSNGRYSAGSHLVRSYPDLRISESHINPEKSPQLHQTIRKCRHSVVFVLRAHSPIPINTDDLTTSITGPFRKPIRHVTAHDLFSEIESAHFNINTGVEERNEQKRKLAEMNYVL